MTERNVCRKTFRAEWAMKELEDGIAGVQPYGLHEAAGFAVMALSGDLDYLFFDRNAGKERPPAGEGRDAEVGMEPRGAKAEG